VFNVIKFLIKLFFSIIPLLYCLFNFVVLPFMVKKVLIIVKRVLLLQLMQWLERGDDETRESQQRHIVIWPQPAG